MRPVASPGRLKRHRALHPVPDPRGSDGLEVPTVAPGGVSLDHLALSCSPAFYAEAIPATPASALPKAGSDPVSVPGFGSNVHHVVSKPHGFLPPVNGVGFRLRHR